MFSWHKNIFASDWEKTAGPSTTVMLKAREQLQIFLKEWTFVGGWTLTANSSFWSSTPEYKNFTVVSFLSPDKTKKNSLYYVHNYCQSHCINVKKPRSVYLA